ncbi:MAG: cupin domain-containing protein [Gemmatimonadetes bacterium]|nr:cupin domain-containing protein [Gemmatimonadota bacterium]
MTCSLPAGAGAHEETTLGDAPAPPPGLKLETLTRQVLEGVAGTEVIVSRVTIPPHTALPKHWHHGEEFAYLLEGALTLWQEGKEDIRFAAGDVGVVPLKQVHTAITGEEGAKLIVFRVHEEGKPERVLVE